MMIRIHSILLADEPTGTLDSKRSQSVTDLSREPHSRRRIICLLTHHERFTRDAQRTSIFRPKG
jgi:putative ABC transport system ATP-binding protein